MYLTYFLSLTNHLPDETPVYASCHTKEYTERNPNCKDIISVYKEVYSLTVDIDFSNTKTNYTTLKNFRSVVENRDKFVIDHNEETSSCWHPISDVIITDSKEVIIIL